MITQVILPIILAFMMFTMGLDLKTGDFLNIKKFPKAFIIGLLLQFLSLPLIAFTISYMFIQYGLLPEYAVGLIILAACPGGVTSNMITHLAKGDSALSVALTAVTSLASIITLPFIVGIALNMFLGESSEVSFPIGKTVIGIFMITTVPVVIGMSINHKFTYQAKKMEKPFRKLASILFIIVIAGAIYKDWSTLQENFMTLALPVIILNLVVMIVAFSVAKLSKLNMSQVTAITYECGLQNGTLAILVSVTFLQNSLMMLPGGMYSIIMFFTAIGYYLIIKKVYGGEQGIRTLE